MSNLDNSSALQRVPLSTTIFHQYHEQFLQEQKPDPLVLKQLQSLHIEWKDGDDNDVNDLPKGAKFQIDKHTNGTRGILTMMGEYTTVTLKACCNWKVPVDNASSMCKMHFELYAQASFTPKSLWKRHAQPQENMGKKEERLNDKIRSGVMSRMKEDPYVRRIMKEETVLLCDTSIQFKLHVPPPPPAHTVENKEDIGTVHPTCTGVSPSSSSCIDELEERVYVSEDALEGLHRGLFSHMESSIFAMELLLAMPYLPQRSPSKNLDERNYKKLEVMLSERVVLRVLEDVMINECEKEGEDDLLSDLHISTKDKSHKGEGLSEVQSSVGKRHKAES